MKDFISENSSLLAGLAAILSILATTSMFIYWICRRRNEQLVESKPIAPPPRYRRLDEDARNMILQLCAALACVGIVVYVAVVVIPENEKKAKEQERIDNAIALQVDAAMQALNSCDLAEFEAKVSEVDSNADAIFSAARMFSKLRQLEFLLAVKEEASRTNVFVVETSRKATLLSVDQSKNKIRKLFEFEYSRYGCLWSPHDRKLAIFVQTGLFSKKTKFYVINSDGKYLKQIHSTNSADELIRWDSDNVILVSEGSSEKEIQLTEENNPR